MPLMYRLLPEGACPVCGSNKGYVVRKIESNLYLVNKGKVVDSKEEFITTEGMCLNCHTKFDMFEGYDTFIPLTELRKLLPEYEKVNTDRTNNLERFTAKAIDNPISKENKHVKCDKK